MLRRDYLMRLVQELATAIDRLLHDREATLTRKQQELASLYRLSGFDADLLRSSATDEILRYIAAMDYNDQYLQRVDMAAQLLWADAMLYIGPIEQLRHLRLTALELYQYLDQHVDDFSLTRQQRIDRLRQLLENNS